jgi:hypothetical protein
MSKYSGDIARYNRINKARTRKRASIRAMVAAAAAKKAEAKA